MDRRKLLNFGAGSALTVLIAACGGGNDAEESGEFDEIDTAEVVEPAIDPATLSSVPVPVGVDLPYLMEVIDAPLRASVVMGETAQIGISVSFYDASQNLLGTALTNAEGIAEISAKARRAVFAEAITATDKLYGLHIYNGLESEPEINIDILQTIFAKVILELAGNPNNYNIGSYVLQDYFRIPSDVNLLNIGHSYNLLDQRLAEKERIKSGLSAKEFSDKICKDILENINDDSHFNINFNSTSNLNSTRDLQVFEIKRHEIAKVIIGPVKSLIEKAIPIPIASQLAGYAFGKFMDWVDPDPGAPNPFIEIYESLALIERKINSLTDRINEIALTNATNSMMMNFSGFSTVMTDLDRLNDGGKNANGDRLELYTRALKALGDDLPGGARDKTLVAHRMFLGCGEFERSSVIDQLLPVVKKKFYSRTSESKYKSYLEFYIAKQAMAHMLLGASYIIRGKESDGDETKIRQKLERLLSDFNRITADIEEINTPTLPERINIDHENKTAWVGVCKNIYELKNVWPTSRTVVYRNRIDKVICSWGSCRIQEFEMTDVKGSGRDDWSGLEVRANMREWMTFAPTVNEETFNFGAWRSPTLEEIRKSFYDDALRLRLKVDVYATSAGFSNYSSSSGRELKAFNSPASGKLALVSASFRKAGGTFFSREEYLDFSTVNFENMEIKSSVKATTAYDYGQKTNVLTFLPVMTVNDSILNNYLPWLVVAAAKAKANAVICR